MATHYAKGSEVRCNLILCNARDLAESLTRSNDDCQAPIILSAVALESFFNELEYFLNQRLIGACGNPLLETLAATLADLEEGRGPLRLKIRLSYFALTGEHLPKGENPYQDLDLLVRLRDALVHPKPATFDMEEASRGFNFNLVRALASRGLIPPSSDREPHVWTYHALTPAVASWAFNVALNGIRLVLNQLPPQHPTREVFESVLRPIQPLPVAAPAA